MLSAKQDWPRSSIKSELNLKMVILLVLSPSIPCQTFVLTESTKKQQPGKWKLITDLSAPEGFRVNDAMDPRLCSLSCIMVS